MIEEKDINIIDIVKNEILLFGYMSFECFSDETC